MTDQPICCRNHGHERLVVLRRCVAADIQRFLNKSPENQAVGNTFKSRLGALLTPQLLCLVGYRMAHWLHARGWVALAWIVTWLNFVVHKVWITPQSCIGPGCMIPHPATVSFHGRAGAGLTLYAMSTCGPAPGRWPRDGADGPTLGDQVTVGGLAVISGPVRVGDETKIGPMACLERHVPPRALVVSRSMRGVARPIAEASPTTAAVQGAA